MSGRGEARKRAVKRRPNGVGGGHIFALSTLALLAGTLIAQRLPASRPGALPAAHAAVVVPVEAPGTVEGLVTSENGRALGNAHLFLTRVGRQWVQRTDSVGRYRFAAVEPGRYVLRVFRLDFRDAERVIEVGDGRVVRVDFRLRPRPR